MRPKCASTAIRLRYQKKVFEYIVHDKRLSSSSNLITTRLSF